MCVCCFINFSEPEDFWLGVEYDIESKKWRTIETKVILAGLDRPDTCMYPGFVGTDYKPKDSERCLVMTGTAWQSTPCERKAAVPAICEYGKNEQLWVSFERCFLSELEFSL